MWRWETKKVPENKGLGQTRLLSKAELPTPKTLEMRAVLNLLAQMLIMLFELRSQLSQGIQYSHPHTHILVLMAERCEVNSRQLASYQNANVQLPIFCELIYYNN